MVLSVVVRPGHAWPVRGSMFVFVPYSVAGHVHPIMPVVAELVRRGHRVRVLATGQLDPEEVA